MSWLIWKWWLVDSVDWKVETTGSVWVSCVIETINWGLTFLKKTRNWSLLEIVAYLDDDQFTLKIIIFGKIDIKYQMSNLVFNGAWNKIFFCHLPLYRLTQFASSVWFSSKIIPRLQPLCSDSTRESIWHPAESGTFVWYCGSHAMISMVPLNFCFLVRII